MENLTQSKNHAEEGRYTVSIDVGGTFTDFVVCDAKEGRLLAVQKILTDSDSPASAVVLGLRDIFVDLGEISLGVGRVVHSTTLLTNAILERQGAKTALITTRGFRDVLEIGTEQMYDIYDLRAPQPAPLVPRQLRREVNERVQYDGRVIRALDDEEVVALVKDLSASGVVSIAVSLIHSYRNDQHERRIRELISNVAPDMAVSISSAVAPVIGEYNRTSTTCADAFVKPLFGQYLSSLTSQLSAWGLAERLYMIMSAGGIAHVETALEFPIRFLESGPAAGAFAGSFYGALVGHEDVLSLDMGGTTAKACLIERGEPAFSHALEVDRVHRFKAGSGLPILAPTVELIEIGAGGGSIAHVDSIGLLKVGPRSSGSDPGPACYGRGGGEATVTDANVVLGYLDPEQFLGGKMVLSREKAESAIATHIATPLGLSVVDAAWGIHAVVNNNMATAARTHIIERNRDPRGLALVALGGAGPTHAVGVCRLLGISVAIIPLGAGVASAIGGIRAPAVATFARSYPTPLHACDWRRVVALLDEMVEDAHELLRAGDGATIDISIAADMRFLGQHHHLRVALSEDLVREGRGEEIDSRFRKRYREVYGRMLANLKVEVLTWYVIGDGGGIAFTLTPEPLAVAGERAGNRSRPVYFSTASPGYIECPVFDQGLIPPDSEIPGPCIIEQPETTAVIPPEARVEIDVHRNAVVRIS